MKTREAIRIAEQNKEKVTELYLTEGRRAVAEFIGMNYNSVGHVLKALELYSKDVQEKRNDAERKKEKCRNPFNEWNEASAYLVGFILGDGSLKPRREGNYRLNIYNNDRQIMEELIKLFYSDKELSVRHYETGKDGYYFDVYDYQVYQFLTDIGLVPNKSNNGCNLPQVPDEYFRHMVRGLLDSDGCVTKNKDVGLRLYFYGHPSYIEQLRVRLPCEARGRILDKLDCVGIYKRIDIEKMYEYLYKDATLFMKRKREVFENCEWIQLKGLLSQT